MAGMAVMVMAGEDGMIRGTARTIPGMAHIIPGTARGIMADGTIRGTALITAPITMATTIMAADTTTKTTTTIAALPVPRSRVETIPAREVWAFPADPE